MSHVKILENIIWLLSNIVGEGVKYRDEVIKRQNIINKIYELAKQENNPINLNRIIVFFFSSIVKGKPEVNHDSTNKSLEVLTIFFKDDDFEILRDICWGFSCLSDSDYPEVQRFLIDKGIIKILIECNPNDVKELKIPLIRILGNLLTKNDNLAEVYQNLYRN
jgi:hypothetical protein